LPEVSAAERSSWDEVMLPGLGESLPPHGSWLRALAAGEHFSERVTVVIPESGYYAVVASVFQRSRDPEVGRHTSDVAHKVIWLWINPNGGRVTESFDPAIFPEGTRQESGPLSSAKRPPKVRKKTGLTVQSMPLGLQIWAEYLNRDIGAWAPLVAAQVKYRVLNAGGSLLHSGSTSTDESGYIWVYCYPTERIEMEVQSVSEAVTVMNYNLSGDRTVVARATAPCDNSQTRIQTNDESSHLYTNLKLTIEESDRTFASRTQRAIATIDGLRNTAYYSTGAGGISVSHINISPLSIWYRNGVFTAAHEWGHMFHDKDLGGIIRYAGGCPSQHQLDGATTLECALVEGFPTYYASVTRGMDTGILPTELEANGYYRTSQTTDGAVVEGAVAAFFTDLTDSKYSEASDRVQTTHKYVADIIRSCQARYVNSQGSSIWTYNRGIDHLVYCFERRRPYSILFTNGTTESFFGTRSSRAESYSHFGSDPSGTLADDIRRLWLVNLYSKRPSVGTSPAFVVGAQDEAPEDPSTGGDSGSGCGTLRLC
jgi:hypothetical protein